MKNRSKLLRLGSVAACSMALLAMLSCGSDSNDALATKVKVKALDNQFGSKDPTVRIAVGGQVTWTNDGRNDHNVISTDGSAFGIGEKKFRPGDTYSASFPKAGTYAYYCSLHGNTTAGMIGTVLVGDVKAPAPAVSLPDVLDIRASGKSIRVPADSPTIQGAVDKAKAGDLILINPGVYKEEVTISTGKDGITLRGLDRQKVILDGEFDRANGVKVTGANGVVVENMTARSYTRNGFYWTDVNGYRGSYLTALRNGDYGIYSFKALNGQFDHSYAAGSPDAGFYIGGCQPCNALISNVVSEWNGLGYSGTNAGGNLQIINSIFRFNRAGIVPNSGSYEPFAPQKGNVIAGNLIYANNNGKTPAIDIAITAMGNGIVVAGGLDNTIEKNRVIDHDLAGIVILSYPENAENFWLATGNEVRENLVSGSGLGDLALWFDGDGKLTGQNCFEGNEFTSSAPKDLEKNAPCPAVKEGDLTDGAFDIGKLATNEGKPASVGYAETVLPEFVLSEHLQMPDAANAPARPAIDVVRAIDVASIVVPDAPK